MLPSASKGFTLIELLLALGISAMVAVLAWLAFDSVMAADAAFYAQVQRVESVQRALNLLDEDLSQTIPRTSTTVFGSVQSAFVGDTYSEPQLEFTRGGQPVLASLVRSELQRVRYVLRNKQLWRAHWWVLDGADPAVPEGSVLLLDGVETMRVEFLPLPQTQLQIPDFTSLSANAVLWETTWDSGFLRAGQLRAIPLAVKLTLELDSLGKVQHVIELP